VPVAAVATAVAVLGLAGAAAVLDSWSSDAQRAAALADRGIVSASVGLVVGLCGAVILAARPGHRIGLVLAATGIFWSVDGVAESYAVWGLQQEPARVGTGVAYWFVSEVGSGLLVALPLVLVLYPTGRLPVGRGRPLAVTSVALSVVLPLVLVLLPDQAVYGDELPARIRALLPGLAVPVDPALGPVVLPVAQVLTLLALPLGAAVVFIRHGRAGGAERTQLRWLLWAALVCLLAGLVMLLDPNGPLGLAALVVALAVTSASIVIGIIRPQLVDIDALVGGTLVYGGIAAGVVALDFLLLAGVSRLLGDRLGERQVTILVLVLAVAAYGPLRAWLTALVRRRLLGRRGERYEVVSTLAAQLEETGRLEDQLPALATTIAEAFRIPFVRVDVIGPGGLGLSATHGEEPAATRAVPISYRGEQIGSVTLPDGGIRAMLSRRDQVLLVDVVRQAAIAVRSSLLTRELQESREQLVLAREEDRRRIRRDLHDGLGPVLGGVAMRLDAAGNAVGTDPQTARRLVAQSRADITEALADVRRLVHGLRPPALDDLGLLAAVQQQVERTQSEDLRVAVQADELAGLPAAVEVAAYRIVSEALANVSRHAAAGVCTVTLRKQGGELGIEVADDGCGIGPDVVAGVGLRSLRERVEELGGRYEVVCPSGGGTRVRAWLPTGQAVPA
jgi:signal transduction histidine kinase